MKKLSHINSDGKANMVDVSSKRVQHRVATAKGFIHLNSEAISQIKNNLIKKGDVLSVAEIAGIMGGKKTSELIPLCHQLNLSKIEIKTNVKHDGVEVVGIAICDGKTGVEMEALTGVSIALLTIYDMCKAIDKHMKISDIVLLEKTKS